jgi:hypothetical protein
MPIQYTLSPKEWAFVADKAKKRNDIKTVGSSIKFDGGKSALNIHTYGMAAEYSFSQLTGLPYSFNATKWGDDGYDFQITNQLTIEIKYRYQRNRDFALNTDKLEDFTADLGVLFWPGPKEHSFEMVGWTTKVAFAFVAERCFLKGWRLLIPWQKLRKPEELLDQIKKWSIEGVFF